MSSIPHRTRLAAVLAVGALAVAGCGSSSSDDGATKPSSSDTLSKAKIFTTGFVGTDDAATPKQGGQLTIADYGEPRSLDPTVTYADGATGGSAMAAIYDELVRYDYTSNKYVPELAKSLTSDDDTVWTLKLRDGVKFTNGQPLNAAAVLSSLKYYESKYGYQSNLLLANVASMKATDDLTVVFTLRSPWSGFPDMLAQGPGMVLAPAAYQNPKAFKPIGAGPFTYGSYSPGESLVLNANPNYVGGKPYLDSLKFVWIGATDDQAKVDALDSGTADVAYLRDAEVVAKTRQESGRQGFLFSAGMNDVLNINTRDGHPGSDPLVRQAINYAVDADAYVKRATNDAALATKGMVGPGSPWYTEAPAQFDTAKAKDLVKQAKAKGFDGKVTFVYSASPTAQAGAVLVKAMLDSVGFTVELEPLRSVADQVQKLYVDHAFDLAIASATLSDIDPYSRLASLFGAKSPSNLTGWSSPDMDKLVAELEAKDTPEQGKDVMAQIQTLLGEQVPQVSLDAAGVFDAWNKDVHGIQPTTSTMTLFTKAWKG